MKIRKGLSAWQLTMMALGSVIGLFRTRTKTQVDYDSRKRKRSFQNAQTRYLTEFSNELIEKYIEKDKNNE